MARKKSKNFKKANLPIKALLLAALLVAVSGIALVFVSQASQSTDTTRAGTVVNFSSSSNLSQQVSANNGTTRYSLAVRTGLEYCWWGTNGANAQVQGSVHYSPDQIIAYDSQEFKVSSAIARPLFCFTAQNDSSNAEVFISITGDVKFSSMRVTTP